MSLAIVIKGTEGIVLAVDSRVTLTAQGPSPIPNTVALMPCTFDNATKLLQVPGQKFVGAVTYGAGAIGKRQPRTAHSFMPEFEAELSKNNSGKRLSVKAFAEKLSEFFQRQWRELEMPAQVAPGATMIFYVAGYNEGEPYGRVYELRIPNEPVPKEWHADDFGVVWGGQQEFVNRLILGFDPQLCDVAQELLKFTDEQKVALAKHLSSRLQASVPFQFIPLQDCINLAILLIRVTMTIQTFLLGVRGVGGAIDVASITKTDGINPIQAKSLKGEIVN